MKKVLAAALICVVSSFAAWDYFPVIEYGKGEAKLGIEQSRQGDDTDGGSYVKIRYSPMENLELMSQPFGTPYSNYVLGARYQIIPILSAGLDVGFPISTPIWGFTPNVQFSMPLTDALALGSNAQVSIYTEESDSKIKPGMDLSAGVELDLTMGKSLIWLGCDVNTGLTTRQVDGKTPKGPDGNDIKVKDENRGLEIVPMLGYVATPGNLSLGTNVGMAFGKDAGHENFNTFIGVDFAVKF